MLICYAHSQLFGNPQFLTKLSMMDYSLLLGVHDCEQAEQEHRERLERPERNKSNNLIHLFNKARLFFSMAFINVVSFTKEQEQGAVGEDSYNEDDDDSCGSTVGVGGATGPTPPDSPQAGRDNAGALRSLSQQYPYQYTGKIVPELDIYAISCKEGTL